MAKALDTLARLRRLETEQAKRDLAVAVAAEIAATRALTQAQAMVAREIRVQTPDAPGAFAAWLPSGKAEIERCQTAERQAGAAREAARAALANRRAALKATDTLIEARARQERLEAEHRAIRMIDDLGRGEKDLLF